MKEVIEKNRLIRNFMSNWFDKVCASIITEEDMDKIEMQYHSCWDDLMPVVHRIKYGNPFTNQTYVVFNELSHESNKRYKAIENSLRNLSIDQTHECVYRFITYYNTLPQTKEAKDE